MIQAQLDARLMRLLTEILLVVGVSETSVMFLLPLLAPNVSEVVGAVMDAGMLTFIAGPILLWRFVRLTKIGIANEDDVNLSQYSDKSSRHSMGWALGTFVIGCTLTGTTLYYTNETEQRLGQQKFDTTVERLREDVEARLAQPTDGINAIAGLYNTGVTVDRRTFDKFFAVTNLTEYFPGVSSLGVIEQVDRHQVGEFVSLLRQQDSAQFSLHTVTSQDDLFVVRHMVSPVRDTTWIGADLGEYDAARQAMLQAAATGKVVLSDPFHLSQPGKLSVPMALYVRATSLSDPGARSRRAFAFAVIRFDEVLSTINDSVHGLAEFELFDGTSGITSPALFNSHARKAGAVQEEGFLPDKPRFSRLVEIRPAGHSLLIRAMSTPEFEAGVDTSKATLLGAVLLLLTLFSSMAVWLLVRGRDRALLKSMEVTSTNERLVKAMQVSNSSVVIVNERNEIEWANAAFSRITGFSLDESLGQNVEVLHQLPHTDPQVFQSIRAAITSGKDLRTEVRSQSRDGREFWLDVDIQILHGVDGEYAGVIAVETDISERKEYEKTLEESRSRAESATRAKGQFLANMSHEIRTPMNAILGMLKLLQMTDLNAQQYDYAGKMEGAARALLALINGILDFSKVDAGKMHLDVQPFLLEKLMRDLAVILSANVSSHGVDILYDMEENVPARLVGDCLRLQQVLVNLGGNALKFTERGQVVIAVRVLHLHESYAKLEFSVTDTGIGIAQEQQGPIFDVFSQAETSTTRRYGGTGLGLAISKRLVELMGGNLRLQSEYGKGSTFAFSVVLPVAADERSLPASRMESGGGALKVLVVDDNLVAGEITCKMAQRWGWRAQVVTSGEAAITLMRSAMADGQAPFDVVYLEWYLPGMDGWDTAAQVRELCAGQGRAAPKIIMLTASNRHALDQRSGSERSILNDFLVKPVTAVQLLESTLELQASDFTLRLKREAAALIKPLADMRILVVDDNPINQQVAAELLTSEGALVALAGDGQQGVDAVAQANPQFDVVLMDLQMPVMDGMTATRKIRQELGLSSLPIVAVTANVQPADRAACLEAGMDDHVGKPFDLAELVAKLLTISGRNAGVAQDSAAERDLAKASGFTAHAPWLEQELAPALAVIDLRAALQRMGGKRQAYLRSARTFLEQLPTAIDTFNAASQSAPGQATMLMHTLKGTAATLGAMRVADSAARLERMCRAGATMDLVRQETQTLQTAIQRAMGAMDMICDALEGSGDDPVRGLGLTQPAPLSVAVQSAVPASMEHVRMLLSALNALLEAEDLGALEHYAKNQHALQELPERELHALELALQNLDLAQANALCRSMLAQLA